MSVNTFLRRRNALNNAGGFNFTTDLMAYWKLATNSLDSSINGNDGVDLNMTYSGGYAEFGAGNKKITVPDTNDLSFTDGVNDLSAHILISFIWLDKSSSQFIFIKRNAGEQLEWQILNFSGNLAFYLQSPTAESFIYINIPNGSISLGVLNTLQFSYDGSKLHTGIKAYLNGNTSVGTTASSLDTYTGQVNGTADVTLGNASWSLSPYFRGNGKEWAVWKDRTMSGLEIQEIHDRVIAGTPLI